MIFVAFAAAIVGAVALWQVIARWPGEAEIRRQRALDALYEEVALEVGGDGSSPGDSVATAHRMGMTATVAAGTSRETLPRVTKTIHGVPREIVYARTCERSDAA